MEKFIPEISNLVSITILWVILGFLLLELFREKRRYIYALLFCTIVPMIVLNIRQIYYIGFFNGWLTRAEHGRLMVTDPAPFLWMGITVLIGGYIFEIRYRRKLQYTLEILNLEEDYAQSNQYDSIVDNQFSDNLSN